MIAVILISAVVLMIGQFIGTVLSTAFRALDAEAGGCLALAVGIIIFASNASGSIGWYGVLLTIATALFGAAIAAAQIYFKYSGDNKRMKNTVTFMCGAFITGIFIVSPQFYELLPINLNKWCLYLSSATFLVTGVSGFFDTLGGETEDDDDNI